MADNSFLSKTMTFSKIRIFIFIGLSVFWTPRLNLFFWVGGGGEEEGFQDLNTLIFAIYRTQQKRSVSTPEEDKKPVKCPSY